MKGGPDFWAELALIEASRIQREALSRLTSIAPT